MNPTKLTGWKMLVVALMLMLAVTSVSAQHHNGPPPPPPNIDSIIAAHIDSFLAHHPIDTFPTPPPPPVDTNHHHFDSIPTPPPLPIHYRDTVKFRPDTSNWHPIPIDSLPHLPGCHRDTTGNGHDSIPTPPLPPLPPPPFPDSTWTGGGHDTLPPPPPCPPLPPDTTPHHKDLITGADNNPASISIFPNPVVNTSTMRIANASNTVTFRLYDMNGQIAREMINLGNGDIDFIKGNLTPGVYIYEMIDGNTIASTGRVLIQ